MKQGLLLITLLLLSTASLALDSRHVGEMADEHLILEQARIKIMPSTDDFNAGLVKMNCQAEVCPIDTARFHQNTRFIDIDNKNIPREQLADINESEADIHIKRDTDTIDLIRLYPQ